MKCIMKEELYKWYPIVDEGEYWTDYDIVIQEEHHITEKIKTVVTDGIVLWTYKQCYLGWGTMAKVGNWKYMRIKID